MSNDWRSTTRPSTGRGCSAAGLGPATIDNRAAYLGGWHKQIRGDKRRVVTAAGAAQRAADWILGNRDQPG